MCNRLYAITLAYATVAAEELSFNEKSSSARPPFTNAKQEEGIKLKPNHCGVVLFISHRCNPGRSSDGGRREHG